MGNSKLRGKDLSKIGYDSDRLRSMAINIMSRQYKYLTKIEKLNILIEVKDKPEDYVKNELLGALADQFINKVTLKSQEQIELKKDVGEYRLYGQKHINENAIQQMNTAMQLPISVKGAMMPDAHHGYGLPIGGVLATKNAVIPYGVGVDIGCRMSLTLYDADERYIDRYRYQLKQALGEHTFFGTGVISNQWNDHEVLERDEFNQLKLLKNLHSKSAAQLGTSGSGNHFVEFGMVKLNVGNRLQLPHGNYMGILTHSGSRGLGASIAKHYTNIAIENCPLPKGAQHLAWLNLDKQNGQEYWMAMNLAGDYAKACHDVIHDRLAKSLGLKSLVKVENHHNFAWKEEQENGEELIVHRKGATPANEGELGIIPGSMATRGFIVSGKGNEGSLSSASHGAGRKWSRKKAKESTTKSELNKFLKQQRVTLIGGGVDESPIVYKDIEEVIKSQHELVNIEGTFVPRIVRMDKS